MKKLTAFIFALFVLAFGLCAQNVQEVESVERDVAVDSTLAGLSVMEAMPLLIKSTSGCPCI